ncbi:MAG: hypothetical protein H6718_03895 [Polyangiaceae bacterium]|nr:hypothetical protein [Myxococcales bacterium]MCB9584510.1 hypothetical protein [Polyangiaceae bacterium]MCB9609354.1 hypothetical protein [Polyangiaceae bacterium]
MANRGRALIEEVIAAIQAEGELPSDRMLDAPKPKAAKGLAASAISELRLSNGMALPPSLAAWLEYDARWLPLEIADGVVQGASFAELVADAVPDVGEMFGVLGESLLTAECYRLWVPQMCPEMSAVFLYGAHADAEGELPVLCFAYDDDGILGVFAAGFDVYLARVMGVCKDVSYAIGEGPPAYAKAANAALDGLLKAADPGVRKQVYVAQGVISVGSLIEFDG